MFPVYDVIIVGAGHAGCEAAATAATLGSKVLLITMNMNTIAQMSCNPAMGGVAKGQIIREIDALGGQTGIVTDESMIQFRMLNRSKGAAMWSPRSQNDRMRFAELWRLKLENTTNVDFWQEMVKGIIVEKGKVIGVQTGMGLEIFSKSVILTNGTFLNGIIHIGEKQFGGGRTGEKAATGLTEQLQKFGFVSGRMKTGTPPRVDGRSLHFDKMEEQKGDQEAGKFSFTHTTPLETQRSCFITYTNRKVHDILRGGFQYSPMFNGRIQGLGPRYCPSIEDKIERFSERDRHQIFVEPEGWNTVEIYVNGFSTSLPEDVQYKALKEIPGFEKVKMFRPGYAIEYDYFPPTQLHLTLETKLIRNLFFAGQINGTTGYEEAACQGLIAGINAHHTTSNKEPFILKRSDAYIGVLIDDLINKGTDEPYRMFTSRAEFRILLRQDNADLRLTKIGHKLGLANNTRLENVLTKENNLEEIQHFFKSQKFTPEEINNWLSVHSSSPIKEKIPLERLLKRPELSIKDFKIGTKISEVLSNQFIDDQLLQAETLLKYETYIEKEQLLANKMEQLESHHINSDLDYNKIKGLSAEARQKLENTKPSSIGQASRISGVSPADIAILLVYLGK